MLKKIISYILLPVLLPLGLVLRCRRKLRIKKLIQERRNLKKELRLLKEQNEILSSALERSDPDWKAEKQKLGLDRILKK